MRQGLRNSCLKPLSYVVVFHAALFAVIWYFESGKEERCFRQHFDTARERNVFFDPKLRAEVLVACANNPGKLLNAAAQETWLLALEAASPTELQFRVQLYLAMFGDITRP
jgi:hypothetical protein